MSHKPDLRRRLLPFRVQRDDLNAFPVSSLASPSFRLPFSSGLVDPSPLGKDGFVLSDVPILWRHEADRAVKVFRIVPEDEVLDPRSRREENRNFKQPFRTAGK